MQLSGGQHAKQRGQKAQSSRGVEMPGVFEELHDLQSS